MPNFRGIVPVSRDFHKKSLFPQDLEELDSINRKQNKGVLDFEIRHPKCPIKHGAARADWMSNKPERGGVGYTILI